MPKFATGRTYKITDLITHNVFYGICLRSNSFHCLKCFLTILPMGVFCHATIPGLCRTMPLNGNVLAIMALNYGTFKYTVSMTPKSRRSKIHKIYYEIFPKDLSIFCGNCLSGLKIIAENLDEKKLKQFDQEKI